MLLFINYPHWLKPEVFGFLNLPPWLGFLKIFHWYGLMYIIGITVSFSQCMYLLKKENFLSLNKKIVEDYYFFAILGLLAVARIILENFRQPDSQFQNIGQGKFIGYIAGTLTMGQILSWLMLIFGLGIGTYFYLIRKKNNLKPV